MIQNSTDPDRDADRLIESAEDLAAQGRFAEAQTRYQLALRWRAWRRC